MMIPDIDFLLRMEQDYHRYVALFALLLHSFLYRGSILPNYSSGRLLQIYEKLDDSLVTTAIMDYGR